MAGFSLGNQLTVALFNLLLIATGLFMASAYTRKCKQEQSIKYFFNKDASMWINCIGGCPGYYNCESCCFQEKEKKKTSYLRGEPRKTATGANTTSDAWIGIGIGATAFIIALVIIGIGIFFKHKRSSSRSELQHQSSEIIENTNSETPFIEEPTRNQHGDDESSNDKEEESDDHRRINKEEESDDESGSDTEEESYTTLGTQEANNRDTTIIAAEESKTINSRDATIISTEESNFNIRRQSTVVTL